MSSGESAEPSRAKGLEVKIVYRILRLISDLALAGFYSEVCVRGKESVKQAGPLILCPCHHNEILDIATLSATAPHRRIIGYWAKASLFRNPVSRFILESAGSIPVARASQDASKRGPQHELFAATHALLASGGALGVFPEGTSYTLPRIVQVKEGAAKAALEFANYMRGSNVQVDVDVVQVIPVGIVPTDKAQYRSRLYVEYGEPLSLAQYAEQLDDDDTMRSAIQHLTQAIQHRLVKLTINAPDWDTLYASRMARDILWGHEKNVQLDKFVPISQSLIELFSDDANDIDLSQVKRSLLRYHALLHHAGLSHASLPHESCFGSFLSVLYSSVPLILSLPAHVSHFPGYVLGALAMKKLGGDEEEARAQYGAIIGGAGVGLGTIASSWYGLKMFRRVAESDIIGEWMGRFRIQEVLQRCISPTIRYYGKNASVTIARSWLEAGRLGNMLCVFGLAWVLCKWHNRVIDANHARFQRMRAAFTVLFGLFSSRRKVFSWSDAALSSYLTTPPPPANPFVSASASFSRPPVEGGSGSGAKPKASLSTRELVRPLLQAREEAYEALETYLRSLETKNNVINGKKREGEDEGYESVDEDARAERKERNRNKNDIVLQLKKHGAGVDRLLQDLHT